MSRRRYWLKNKQEESGYSVNDLLKELGIAKSTWSGYVNGLRDPGAKNGYALSKLLGFPMEWFYSDEKRRRKNG